MNTPTIVKRKVYAMGDGGLGILLPPAWTREKGVKAGGELLLIADNKITIQPATLERIRQAHRAVEGLANEGNAGG